MEHSLHAYLQRQDTNVLVAVLSAPEDRVPSGVHEMIDDILEKRRYLLQAYSPYRLARMSTEELLVVLKREELYSDDIVTCRPIIGDILTILWERDASISPPQEVISYMHKHMFRGY